MVDLIANTSSNPFLAFSLFVSIFIRDIEAIKLAVAGACSFSLSLPSASLSVAVVPPLIQIQPE